MTRNVITTVLCLLCAVALTASDAQAAKRPKGKSASKSKAKKGGKKSKGSGQVALFNREKKKEAAKPKTKKAKERARTLAANRAALKGRASVEDIDDEIEILKELLDIERGSPSEADTLLELSYVLWDRALAYELEAYDTYYTVGIAKAEESGEKRQARRLKVEQQNLLEESRGTKTQVIDFLKRIERRFPSYNKLDEVLYALGFHLAEMSRHGESVDAYMRLVRKRPKSAYLAEAYFGIGNYYFGKNQGGQAMKWFAKVKKFPQSNAYGWALYYEAWVHYNRMNYRVATNACLDELRRRSRRPQPGLPDHEDIADEALGRRPSLDPGEAVTARIDVDDALAQLPEEFKAPVVLRDLAGLDYAEIAEVLNLAPGTVRSRIARGRGRLADIMAGNHSPPDERQST